MGFGGETGNQLGLGLKSLERTRISIPSTMPLHGPTHKGTVGGNSGSQIVNLATSCYKTWRASKFIVLVTYFAALICCLIVFFVSFFSLRRRYESVHAKLLHLSSALFGLEYP